MSEIVGSNSPNATTPYKPPPAKPHDMDDSRDMPESQPLKDILEHCQKYIWPHFHKADLAALNYQRKHRKRANWVAWLGAAAVILATVQLLVLAASREPEPRMPVWLAWLWLGAKSLWHHLPVRILPFLRWYGGRVLPFSEFVVVLVLVGLVLLGLSTFLKQAWLLERYKAERLRLLKFGFLLRPELWNGDPIEIQRCKDV